MKLPIIVRSERGFGMSEYHIKKSIRDMSKSVYYKCGHNRKPVFLSNGDISYAAYLQWKETVGFEGNKSKCWECFCKEK